mmetsp:Transcript_65822/g.146959  ORF Transcript_65822/g.146959 Transcript_65822/m.146959 type:complete len:220 (-) Transcript_65822:262-921(-)
MYALVISTLPPKLVISTPYHLASTLTSHGHRKTLHTQCKRTPDNNQHAWHPRQQSHEVRRSSKAKQQCNASRTQRDSTPCALNSTGCVPAVAYVTGMLERPLLTYGSDPPTWMVLTPSVPEHATKDRHDAGRPTRTKRVATLLQGRAIRMGLCQNPGGVRRRMADPWKSRAASRKQAWFPLASLASRQPGATGPQSRKTSRAIWPEWPEAHTQTVAPPT